MYSRWWLDGGFEFLETCLRTRGWMFGTGNTMTRTMVVVVLLLLPGRRVLDHDVAPGLVPKETRG